MCSCGICMWKKQSPKKKVGERREVNVPEALMCADLQSPAHFSHRFDLSFFLSFCASRIILFQVFAFSFADALSVAPHSENSFYFLISFKSTICVTQTTPQPTENHQTPRNKCFALNPVNITLITKWYLWFHNYR